MIDRRTLLAGTWGLPFASPNSPNILMIVVDDLVAARYWRELEVPMPNLEALLSRSVHFADAHAPGVVCGATRPAMLWGIMPHRSGLYDNGQDARAALGNRPSLPEYFRRHGYHTIGLGKIFHTSGELTWYDPRSWDVAHTPAYNRPYPPKPINGPGKFPWDWGMMPHPPEKVRFWGDTEMSYLAGQVLRGGLPAPFFVAVGLTGTHFPFYAPGQFFDGRDVGPATLAGDLDDVPEMGRRLAANGPPDGWIKAQQQAAHLVASYRACLAFLDWQIGRVMGALDAGPHRGDTVVCLWSDHGFHLGQKQHWTKRTLWDCSTHIPFAVGGAGLSARQVRQPVSALGLFATLVDLCGLPEAGVEGESLRPLIEGDKLDTHALTTQGRGNYAVRVGRWRYIRYNDGAEELYDVADDPHEWHNLAAKRRGVAASLRGLLPERSAPPGGWRRWLPVVGG